MICRSDDLYVDIKENVTMQQVLEKYGLHVKKHLCICPFHDDKKPSMRVYKDGFFCFACNTGGDVIKFVALYLNISNYEAAKIIANDFGIRIDNPVDYVALKARQAYNRKAKRFAEWIKKARSILDNYHRELYRTIEDSNELTDERINAFKQYDWVCYLLDLIDTEDTNEQIKFYNTFKKEVERIERIVAVPGRGREQKVG